jgi:hypothetical protein
MRLRERDDSDDFKGGDAGGPSADSTELRNEGDALLAAADAAIARALSQNSAEFLAQSRQMGGQ